MPLTQKGYMSQNTPLVTIVSGSVYAVGAIPMGDGSHVVGCVIALEPGQLKVIAQHIEEVITLCIPESHQ